MNKFVLELFLHIAGFGSASGLVYNENQLAVVSDADDYLYTYSMVDHKLHSLPLKDNAGQQLEKKIKPDYEAITKSGDYYYIFASGSKEQRTDFVSVNAKTKEVVHQDLSNLYENIVAFHEMDAKELNIEGVVKDGADWLLFNRGNGKHGLNFIATVQGNNLVDDFNVVIDPFKLPKIDGEQTGFSDAVLVGKNIYFLATAEGSKDVVADGNIGGSLLGCIDLKKMKLKWTKVISKTQKFEGITVFEESKKKLSFLLCEDPDNGATTSDIYKITIKK
ncbi:MAG: hypothetical protein KBS98_02450 [Flavobacterium sp.]|nr:hypothetical protein [Candidatus Neoflavobacterium equi]